MARFTETAGLLVEHLAGKHDQRAHGRRGGVGATFDPSRDPRALSSFMGSQPDLDLGAALARFPADERQRILAVAAGTNPPKTLADVPIEHSEHFNITRDEALEELNAMAEYRPVWLNFPDRAFGTKEMGEMLDAAGGVVAYTYPKDMIARLQREPASFFEAVLAEHLAGKHDQHSHGRRFGSGGQAALPGFGDPPSAATSLGASLDHIEGEIRGFDGGEIGVVLSPGGQVLIRKQQMGDPDGPGPRRAGLSFTEEESALFGGNVFTHNHPRLGDSLENLRVHDSFSPDDIMSSVGMNVAEARMVNAVSTHSLKPGPNGWGSFEDVQTAAMLTQLFEQNPTRISFNQSVADKMGWTYEITND